MMPQIHAFLKKDQIPPRDEWQQSINALGYQLELDPELQTDDDFSHVPCTINGTASSFEIHSGPGKDYLDMFPGLDVGDRDWCLTLMWGLDLLESLCVMMACVALIDTSDPVLYLPDQGIVFDKPGLMSDIEGMLMVDGDI